MKYKNKKKVAEGRRNWWDKQSKAYQASTTRPGSEKK